MGRVNIVCCLAGLGVIQQETSNVVANFMGVAPADDAVRPVGIVRIAGTAITTRTLIGIEVADGWNLVNQSVAAVQAVVRAQALDGVGYRQSGSRESGHAVLALEVVLERGFT